MTEPANSLAAEFMARQDGTLPDVLGFVWSKIERGLVEGWFEIQRLHFAPNGYLHAGTVVAFADNACGYGCAASLPAGAIGFTTVELKANLLGTAREGVVRCTARLVHGGRTTQVWDAEVRAEGSDKPMALFRCTQMALYPRE